jgi:hypothetical protein
MLGGPALCPLTAVNAAVTSQLPVGNCMTHHPALEDFLDTSQVLFHKSNKVNLPVL